MTAAGCIRANWLPMDADGHINIVITQRHGHPRRREHLSARGGRVPLHASKISDVR
jgi:hypothetical protein